MNTTPHLELAYVGFEVADPDALSTLFTEVVGLLRSPSDEVGAARLRNDDRAARLIITEGTRDDLEVLGFAVEDDAALEAYTESLSEAGFTLVDDEARARRRGVRRLRRGPTPWGIEVELVVDLEAAPTPFASPAMASGFQTAGVGMGHVALAVLDFAESERFLLDGLAMEQSDWIETELMEGVDLEVRFYHCNQRHHTVALAKVPFDLGKVLHHVQVEANARDDVGFAFDRAFAAGVPIANGIGVHDNEGAFSFCATSPAGFLVEVGHGTKTITSPWRENRRYDRISRWGHQAVLRA